MVKYAIDCEMVGSGNRSILARVSIVNENGTVVIDEYVKPTSQVTDYRTCVSGIKRQRLANGSDFSKVQKMVQQMINGAILVGHSLSNDLAVLGLSHPEHNRRDLATYGPLKRNNQPVALQTLAMEYLGRFIQEGEHDSVQDAKACMEIYKKFANQWG
ncbi:RNA exonuclease 4 [Bicyclus anynana]|uniref:RNA exonuclease 4 n=1 Tax=Bicyclus anynana TaxID=110368 RepID=A0A6J1NDX7_BICAN|nr:RNA exonuclease 4 [Bicyclus anynana]